MNVVTGGYYRQEPQPQFAAPLSPRLKTIKNTGLKFLKRLSNIRQSVKKQTRQDHYFPPSPSQAPTNFDDSDKIFFRGFSATDGVTYDSVAAPTAPPRRRKSRLTRSFSLTYGDIISNKAINELYPAFPRSTPIYAVVDKSKKKSRLTETTEEIFQLKSEPNLPDLVTLRSEVRRNSVKSQQSQSTLEDIAEVSLATHDTIEGTAVTDGVTTTDNETIYLTDDREDDSTQLTTTAGDNSHKMVKSESANNSPVLIQDPYVAIQLEYRSKPSKKKSKSKKRKDGAHSGEPTNNDNATDPSRQRKGNITYTK